MRSHAQLRHATFSRVPEKKNTQFLPFMPLVPVVPSKINDKFVSQIDLFNMKKLKCKHCPVPGCGSKFLVRLANHLAQVHELSDLERKYWLQFAKLENTTMVRVYDKDTPPKTISL